MCGVQSGYEEERCSFILSPTLPGKQDEVAVKQYMYSRGIWGTFWPAHIWAGKQQSVLFFLPHLSYSLMGVIYCKEFLVFCSLKYVAITTSCSSNELKKKAKSNIFNTFIYGACFPLSFAFEQSTFILQANGSPFLCFFSFMLFQAQAPQPSAPPDPITSTVFQP